MANRTSKLMEDLNPGPRPLGPVPTPCRFRNPLSKYRVWRNEGECIQCGRCVEVCPYGVHTKVGKFIRRPKSYRCVGPSCQKNDFYCVANCPAQALRSAFTRFTAPWVTAAGPRTCSSATWWQAEFGTLPYTDLEYRPGDSGGGFDKLRFRFPSPGADCQAQARRHLPGSGTQPPGRRPAPDQAVGALVRRRHVLRLGELSTPSCPAQDRGALQHPHLHRRRRLS